VQAGHVDVVKFILAEDGFGLRPGKADADPREMSRWIRGVSSKLDSAFAGAFRWLRVAVSSRL
jgi:hypothetical protein